MTPGTQVYWVRKSNVKAYQATLHPAVVLGESAKRVHIRLILEEGEVVEKRVSREQIQLMRSKPRRCEAKP